MWPLVAQAVLTSLSAGYRAELAGLGLVTQTLWVGIASIPVLIIACFVGSAAGGAVGGVWAVALSWGLQSLAFWVLHRRLASGLSVARVEYGA